MFASRLLPGLCEQTMPTVLIHHEFLDACLGRQVRYTGYARSILNEDPFQQPPGASPDCFDIIRAPMPLTLRGIGSGS